MDQQGTIERIRSVPLFGDFGDKELHRVAAIAKEVEFPAGKVIAKQGESGVGFHMITEGEAIVSVDGVDHATAASDLRTVSLTSWDFNALMDQFPELSRTLLIQLCGRLRAVEKSFSQ